MRAPSGRSVAVACGALMIAGIGLTAAQSTGLCPPTGTLTNCEQFDDDDEGDLWNVVEGMNKTGDCAAYYTRSAMMIDSLLNTNRWYIYWADNLDPDEVGGYANGEIFIDRDWTELGENLEHFLEAFLHEGAGHAFELDHDDMDYVSGDDGERGVPESCSFET